MTIVDGISGGRPAGRRIGGALRRATLPALLALAACSGAADRAGNDVRNEAGEAGSRGGDAGRVDAGGGAANGQAQHLPTVPLRIRTKDGRSLPLLHVELARTPAEQEKGLMYRTDVGPGQGMLFPMLPARMPSFWMKNTPQALDLLFVRTDGSVAKIALEAKPGDPTPIFAEEPVAAVLELCGGETRRLGIAPGARLSWGNACLGARPARLGTAENFCP